MFSKYESAYRYMYEDQLVAAEDDYLEMFEGDFNPDDIDWSDPSCKDALRGLLNELYEDRTDLADLIEAPAWMRRIWTTSSSAWTKNSLQ